MKTTSVTELKAQLARYLRMVRRGTEVQVLERGVPIARLIGISSSEGADANRIDRLAKAGILRKGNGDLAWVLEEAPLPVSRAKVSEALNEDREDRF